MMSAMEGLLQSTHTSLQQFSEEMNTQLTTLDNQERTYSGHLRQSLDRLASSLDKYISRTEGQVSEMSGQRDKARQEEHRLDKLMSEKLSELQGLLQQKQDHFSAYTQQEDELSTRIRENLSTVSSARNEVQSCHSNAQSHEETFLTYTAAHRDATQGWVAKLNENLNSCSQSGEAVLKECTSFTDRCKQSWSDHCTSVCEKLNLHTTSLITQLNVSTQKTEVLQHQVTDHTDRLQTEATDQSDQLTSAIGQVDGQCSAGGEAVTSFSERTRVSLTDQETSLSDFLTAQLQQDVPTGLTPQRREFSYPQNLSKTEPHDLLLQKYRERRERDKDQVVVTLFEDPDSSGHSETDSQTESRTPEAVPDPGIMAPPKDISDNVSEAGSETSVKSGMSSKENKITSSSRSTRSKSSKVSKGPQKTPVNSSNMKTRLPLRTANTPQN